MTAARIVWMPGGVRTEIHLTGADTDGAFCLLADEPPPGWALPAHRHLNEAETIHVVRGSFEVSVEGQPTPLGPGQTVHVPAGETHSGRALGDELGRRIVVFSPAGMEDFFAEVGSDRPESEPDLAAALEAAKRHGWRFGPDGQ